MPKTEETRDIEVGDRKIAVHVLRVRDSGKVERLRAQAASNPVDDPDEQILTEHIYPVLAGCSDGEVPTVEEFLDMPAVEAGVWFEAVDQLNPGLLPSGDLTDEKKES